ncbi:hypothetical protein GBAR_LOCUS24421 [Geodia barretti]|uniref:Uncharacterized protein n=1 Tax=Geodia barretti TaxID=519541 RepID=A0AA35T926_GEOBA|nr:hypothetical protein GBAR_LOCUS24421 [Geodia barretti]
MQGVYLDGCHSTIFLLGSGALTTSPGWTQQCLDSYLRSCRRCRSGLANHHLAVVADPSHPLLASGQVQVGVWSPIRQLVSRTPRPARRRWDRGKGKGRKTRPTQPSPPLVDVHLDYSQLEILISSLDTTGGQGHHDTLRDVGSEKSVAPQNTAPQGTPVARGNVPQDTTPEDTVPQNTVPQGTVLQDSVLQAILPRDTAPQGGVTLESGREEKMEHQSTQLQHTACTTSDSLTIGSENTAPHGIAPLIERDQLPHSVGSQSTQPKDAPSQDPAAKLHRDSELGDGEMPGSILLATEIEHKAEGQSRGSWMSKTRYQWLLESSSLGMDVVAGQLHTLLDYPPWTPGENSITDVHWLVGEEQVPCPSSLPSLTGALLRLRLWHNVELQIVASCRGRGESSEEWHEVAKARVVSADQWTHGLEDIWRGSLHFTEQRTAMKQASRETLVFHGFSLALRPRNLLPSDGSDVSPTLLPDDDITAPRNDIVTSASRVLRDVGLPETGATPTHLEVVQLVDVSTIPLFLFSPFTCTLIPKAGSQYIDSTSGRAVNLFAIEITRTLLYCFQSSSERKSVQTYTHVQTTMVALQSDWSIRNELTLLWCCMHIL